MVFVFLIQEISRRNFRKKFGDRKNFGTPKSGVSLKLLDANKIIKRFSKARREEMNLVWFDASACVVERHCNYVCKFN